MNVKRLFCLKRPCANCPFNKEGAIPLRAGRLEGIKQSLINNDHQVFFCHKTIDPGAEAHNEDGLDDSYQPTGRESYCAGAMGWLYAQGRPNVAMRLGNAFGLLEENDLKSTLSLIETTSIHTD